MKSVGLDWAWPVSCSVHIVNTLQVLVRHVLVLAVRGA